MSVILGRGYTKEMHEGSGSDIDSDIVCRTMDDIAEAAGFSVQCKYTQELHFDPQSIAERLETYAERCVL